MRIPYEKQEQSMPRGKHLAHEDDPTRRQGKSGSRSERMGWRSLTFGIVPLLVACLLSGLVGGVVGGTIPLGAIISSSNASDNASSNEELPIDLSQVIGNWQSIATSSMPFVPGSNKTPYERAGWNGSLPRTGEARILMVRVGFPDILYENNQPFQDGDTLDNLSDAIGRHLDGSITTGPMGYPYESLYAYYLRSSYGKLRIAGEAYDYVAKKGRDEYTDNLESLFEEVLEELGKGDDGIDYANFDGDGDGVLDCVCIRFSGDTTGWNTEWWPHVFTAKGELSKSSFVLDGKSLGSLVMLSYPLNGMLATTTMIHEIGHTLGLPDYYSSPYEMTEARENGEEYAGIGTFDMMGTNMGDHNGFSKWMLGWISDRQVTKVTCDDDGCAHAVRDGEEVDKPFQGHVRVRLDRFTNDGISGTGGIIAVYPPGDDGNDGPLSDFYLLQYDACAGNNSLRWGTQTDSERLPEGFRVFRVQAKPNAIGGGLQHSNNTDSKYDQLIEMLDMDNGAWHQSNALQNIVPTATHHEDGQVTQVMERNGGYGCMLRKDDEIGPDTTPSTNFHEDEETGRTGIHIKVTRIEEDYGLVDIWYD